MELNMVTYWLSWFPALIVGIVTYYLVTFYLRVHSMPPGPFPLPVIGNILEFRGKKAAVQKVFSKYRKKYKDIYTLWLGSNPMVLITNWDLCKEGLVTKRNDFSGRTARHTMLVMLNGNHNLFGNDFGPCWITLRKIFFLAVKNYSVSEKLAELITDVVDQAVQAMLKEEKPVDADHYVDFIFYNVMASSAFGKRYTADDPEFIKLKNANEEFHEKYQLGLPSDALPWLAWFYRKRAQDLKKYFDKFHGLIKEKYFAHKILYKKGIVLDFTDAILAAREEAEEEGKDSLEHLNDGNLSYLLHDFFSVGTSVSKNSLLWILLIICSNPQIQVKIISEIDEKIGSRMPRQEDKRLCPYTFAVLMETWRFRPVVETTGERKTTCDTELGLKVNAAGGERRENPIRGYKIPKGTSCCFNVLHNQMDETLWDEPEMFKPERFLDNEGQLITSRPNGYMPFAMGRRACPGEKLAKANIFLILTRLLQNATIELENGPKSVSLNPEYIGSFDVTPQYKLIVKKRGLP